MKESLGMPIEYKVFKLLRISIMANKCCFKFCADAGTQSCWLSFSNPFKPFQTCLAESRVAGGRALVEAWLLRLRAQPKALLGSLI